MKKEELLGGGNPLYTFQPPIQAWSTADMTKSDGLASPPRGPAIEDIAP